MTSNLNIASCFQRLLQSRLFVVLLLLTGLNHVFAQSTLEAQADFNVSSGRLCFPVLLQDDGALYDVCLQLEAEGPGFRFSLQSAAVLSETLPGIATYSQLGGLTLPIVRFTNGSMFAQVTFNASLDSGSGEVFFTVTGGEDVELLADHSVARIWNEVLLDGIRNDFARPTVHSRNLFHVSALMYDAWSVFDDTADTYLLGKTLNGFTCDYAGMPLPEDVAAARKEAISFGAYRLLNHRFANAPGVEEVSARIDRTLLALGFDNGFVSSDYSSGSAAALGNHLAQCLIDYGLQDGANESNDYALLEYVPINEPLVPSEKGNATLSNPDRWQPLSFEEFRDQSGNIFFGNTPEFVGPEWGMVRPFSLQQNDLTIYQRNGADWWV
ncbi:MAG: hypothetical protein HOG19_04225, partial [Gammaproteobacteria bacterium]|nr:hypothetical protein [Gammaproteobacteria bacterium]